MAKSQHELMTTAEVAKALHKDTRTIQRWAKAGRLPSRKLSAATGTYVFDRADVEALLAERDAA